MIVNQTLQWLGTAALITMYVLMSFFPELHPWNIVAGFTGGTLFLIWTIRVGNRPQMIVNLAGAGIALAGIVRYFG
jgi:hypothetical protein